MTARLPTMERSTMAMTRVDQEAMAAALWMGAVRCMQVCTA